MEKIEIKLKECCLTCENYYPAGIGFGLGCTNLQEVSCLHMAVCQTYNGHNPIEVVPCGKCKRWCPDGTYGTGPSGDKEQYGTCDITKCACKENHFCGYGRRNGQGGAKQ